MNPGKLFEQDFQNSVPHYVYLYRLKDCPGWVSACHCPGGASPRFMPSNDYDFAMFWDGKFWAMELKSTKGVSFRFDCLRSNQRSGLLSANLIHGVTAGLLLNFRKDEETWWMSIKDWARIEQHSAKKSININEVRQMGVQMEGWRKVTRYYWDVDNWMRNWE